MKAELNENGWLVITPETGVESYALKKWCEEKSGNGSKDKDFTAFGIMVKTLNGNKETDEPN